jgi:hypothetical protein
MGKYRYTEPAGFISDSWKASRRLSIDLGLRYEYMMAMYSTADNLSLFDPALYNAAQAVKMTSTGGVVPGSGNIYNGLIRVSNGINPSQAYLVPNASSPAAKASARRAACTPARAHGLRASALPALTDKTVFAGLRLFYDRIQGNPTSILE